MKRLSFKHATLRSFPSFHGTLRRGGLGVGISSTTEVEGKRPRTKPQTPGGIEKERQTSLTMEEETEGQRRRRRRLLIFDKSLLLLPFLRKLGTSRQMKRKESHVNRIKARATSWQSRLASVPCAYTWEAPSLASCTYTRGDER